MKKNFPLWTLTLLLHLTLAIQAQQTTYFKVYYDSLSSNIQANSLVPSFDNGYVVVGDVNGQNGLLLKLDSLGRLVWNRTIRNNATTHPHLFLNSIIATKDSCFVVAGRVFNANNTNFSNAYCAKINSNGDTLWSKTIHEGGYSLHIYSVQQTYDSGYIITGAAEILNTLNRRIFTAKIDEHGALQWSKMISYGAENLIGNAVKQTPDSGYVIIAGADQNKSSGGNGVYLIKLSPLGAIQWTKKYSLLAENWSGIDVLVTKNGFICLMEANKHRIIKTDFNGNILWKNSYPIYLSHWFNSYTSPKLHETSDGGFAFAIGNCSRGAITKIDSVGNVIFSKQLQLNPFEILETKDHGFLVLGNGPLCGVKVQSGFNSEIGIIKTNALGAASQCMYNTSLIVTHDTMISSSVNVTSITAGVDSIAQLTYNTLKITTRISCVSIIGGGIRDGLKSAIKICPNPSKGIFMIETGELQPSQIKIYNTMGGTTFQSDIGSVPFKIDLANQPQGIYYYTLLFKNAIMVSGKLILEK